MKVQIAGQDYILTDQSIAAILASIETFATEQYNKLPDTAKLAAMAAVRALLAYAERGEKDADKKKELRPGKGIDPTVHLVRLLLKHLGDVLPYVECEISTDEQRISNFAFKYAGPSGGSLSPDGNVRQREDDSRQIIGPEAS